MMARGEDDGVNDASQTAAIDEDLYRATVRSLGVSMFLLELAIAGAVLLLAFTLEDSIRILSIVGLWEEDFGTNLWLVWPIAALPVIAVGWAEFRFVPKARDLLRTSKGAQLFGTTTDDELVEINDLRAIVNRYAIFLVAEAFAIGLFIHVGFLNVLLAGILLVSQIGLLMFFRDKARALKAEKQLIS